MASTTKQSRKEDQSRRGIKTEIDSPGYAGSGGVISMSVSIPPILTQL